MGPLAQPDRHDFPRLLHELVPRLTAILHDILIGFEDEV
jgi:hypothetical protein